MLSIHTRLQYTKILSKHTYQGEKYVIMSSLIMPPSMPIFHLFIRKLIPFKFRLCASDIIYFLFPSSFLIVPKGEKYTFKGVCYTLYIYEKEFNQSNLLPIFLCFFHLLEMCFHHQKEVNLDICSCRYNCLQPSRPWWF